MLQARKGHPAGFHHACSKTSSLPLCAAHSRRSVYLLGSDSLISWRAAGAGCCEWQSRQSRRGYRDADLRQPLDHVPGSVEARQDRLLACVDDQGVLGIMRRTEHGRQTGAGAQPKGHIEAVEPVSFA
jgi:hypothetical protein